MTQKAQRGPPGSLHARILELTDDDDAPLPEGGFASPLHGLDWRTLITSGFGMRVYPISGERKFHIGLDISIARRGLVSCRANYYCLG